MPVQIRRRWFDFLAKDHLTAQPAITLFPDGLPAESTPKSLGTDCVMRWYLALHGEDSPCLPEDWFFSEWLFRVSGPARRG